LMQPNTTAREGQKETAPPIFDEATFMAAWREQFHAVIGKPWLMRPWLARSSEFVQRVARHYEHLRQQPRHIRRRLQRQLGVSLAGAALALALLNSPAQAAPAIDALQPLPITANARINGSDCDLIDAIIAANTDTATGACNAGNLGADIITLLNNVTLTAINNNGADGPNGLPVIESEITIEGSSFTISRDAGAPSFRIFEVASTGDLTLNQTTITEGYLPSGRGGAILNAGALTVNNSTFTGNYGRYGGAIAGYAQQIIAAGDSASTTPAVSDHSLGAQRALLTSEAIRNGLALWRSSQPTSAEMADSTITVSNSTFSGNSAKYAGGAIGNNNVLTVSNSTFSGNSALLDGGAIDNNGVLTATNSTFSGNSALLLDGGAIDNNGVLAATNSTFSGNSAKYGGAIANGYFGELTLNNCTLTGNQTNDAFPNAASSTASDDSGGAIYSEGSLTLDRSLISGNTASNGAEVFQQVAPPLVTSSNHRIDSLLAVTSNGNLFGHDGVSGVVGFAPDASDIVPNVGVAAILSGLADNGGDTQTHALIDGSPALDAAGDSGLATDQRGVRRPQGAADDIGAFELERCDEVTITIVKESMPPSATNFRFTSSILASGNRCQDTGSSINDFYLDNPTHNNGANGDNGNGDDGDAYGSSKSFTRQSGEVLAFSEPAVSGWHLMEIVCDPPELATVNLATRSVTVHGEADVTCTFRNAKAAALTVRKYREMNGTPGQIAPEPFLSTWTIRVRTAPNDALVAQAATNALGKVAFSLKPGEYKVCEVQKIGWTQKVPDPEENACYTLTLEPGTATQVDFGNCLTRSCPTMVSEPVNSGETDVLEPVTFDVAVDALDAWVEQWLITPDGPSEQTLEPDVSDAGLQLFLPVVVK
jgi:predicted outer membrane repeat protein